MPAYIRPLFCEGKGPFRWAALSGDPADIAATDAAILDLFPDNEPLARWIRMAQEKVHFQGLPARICWLGYGERHLAGLRFNELVARGDVQAPIVLGRDHLDCGSVASPYRETEAMADGSDAIADWPLLNALVNTASGASWVSIHHGGGVGIGRSIHAGQVCVADGTPLAGEKLERVLTNDPGMGVIRHVDAGYEEAAEVAAPAGRARPHAAVMAPPPGPRPSSPGPPGFAALWESLLPIGRDPGTGGYRRFSWTQADLDCRAWFEAAARHRQLRTDQDRNGNLWAWWDVPGPSAPARRHREPPGLGAGRRCLRRAAGRGVRLRGHRRAPGRGLRPGPADRGGRVHRGGRGPVRRRLPGQPPADRRASTREAARELRDGDGITLAEAMRAAGQDPGLIGRDEDLLARLGCYVELHIEQGRALAGPRTPPWASPRGSGRTAAGGSTSPGRLITRARPRWPTGAIR